MCARYSAKNYGYKIDKINTLPLKSDYLKYKGTVFQEKTKCDSFSSIFWAIQKNIFNNTKIVIGSNIVQADIGEWGFVNQNKEEEFRVEEIYSGNTEGSEGRTRDLPQKKPKPTLIPSFARHLTQKVDLGYQFIKKSSCSSILRQFYFSFHDTYFDKSIQ